MDKPGKLEKLVFELQAIEYWDAKYYGAIDRDNIDVQAFNARQIRRRAILNEVLKKTRDKAICKEQGLPKAAPGMFRWQSPE